jgi:hypothetical protein
MERSRFYAALRRRDSGVFGSKLSQPQVGRLEAILTQMEKKRIELAHAAYILATAYHESDRFRTMEEYASGAAYEGRQTLGNSQPGDGRRFKGRGFVQVTGRRNYTDWSRRLGIDLVGDPALACRLDLATTILIDGMMLGTFTGKKLPDYVAGQRKDYLGARRVVNGTDKATLIAGYAKSFEAALAAAGYSPTAVTIAPAVSPTQSATPAKQTAPAAPEGKTKSGAAGALLGLVVVALAAAAALVSIGD